MNRRAGLSLTLLLCLLGAAVTPLGAAAAEPLLPLPDGPVVAVVPDPAALDQALTGKLRQALSGTLPEKDGAGTAFRRSRVGGKLEEQWRLFAADLPLTWKELMALKPSALGITLLSAGDLEAVLAVRTALAALPITLPKGEARSHGGVAYQLAARGAGDEKTNDRRMGVAWARTGGLLLVATSERGLLLALDRLAKGGGQGPFLDGLVSMKLDLPALRKDRYFRREFLFAEGTAGKEKGALVCALRLEGADLVEVRQGECDATSSAATPAAATWTVAGRKLAAAGWETDGTRLYASLRRALLEPVPSPSDRPVPARKPLPDVNVAAGERYLIDLRQPSSEAGGAAGEGELPRWKELLGTPDGWGWEIGTDGSRRIVLKRPAADDSRLLELARETLSRRAGTTGGAAAGPVTVGPELAGIAVRRRGDWLWLAASQQELDGVPEPALSPAVARWCRLDLDAPRGERKAWEKAEGVAGSGATRPFSDRILGLLGWVPGVKALSVERRRDGTRFTERVVFGTAPSGG